MYAVCRNDILMPFHRRLFRWREAPERTMRDEKIHVAADFGELVLCVGACDGQNGCDG